MLFWNVGYGRPCTLFQLLHEFVCVGVLPMASTVLSLVRPRQFLPEEGWVCRLKASKYQLIKMVKLNPKGKLELTVMISVLTVAQWFPRLNTYFLLYCINGWEDVCQPQLSNHCWENSVKTKIIKPKIKPTEIITPRHNVIIKFLIG